jgi:hypothetical protein
VLCEFLVERIHVRGRDQAGELLSSILLAVPRQMSDGKGVWAMFDAACAFCPTMRSFGHRGIIINVTTFDRAVNDSLDDKLKNRNAALYDDDYGLDLDSTALLELLDWSVNMADPLHDLQNGMRWSLANLSDATLLSDFYFVNASLRNSYALLVPHVMPFVIRFVAFDQGDHDVEKVGQFWRVMGIEADMIDAVSYVDPRWTGGRLLVAGQVERMQGYSSHISDILLYIYKIRVTNEARILSHGPSSRGLNASVFAGLKQVVNMTRQDERATDYHLHGFVKLSTAMMRYSVAASIFIIFI